jgi:phosphopantothenoylcysteine decarboxylase/phosphopantothenate--cysteine ligase
MESVHEVPHINLARQADLIAVIPATADMIARTACGMADDLLTAMLLSFRGKVIFCPAMNPAMFANPFVQKNLGKLRDAGYRIIPPGCGGTACGEEGQGRLADLDTVREEIVRALTEPELAGMRVLVSAGPTREPLDPVRYLSNRSSGRMGFAIAREAFRRGADVTLVSGPVNIPYPAGVRVVNVTTADEMASAIKKLAPDNHVVVMSAAVADYRPLYQSEQKIKKLGASLCLELERTEDIISGLSEIMSESSLIAGFCAETENLLENAQKKLAQKKLDIIIANDVSRTDSGFDVPDNMVVIIDRHGGIKKLPLLTKEEVAARIWDYILTTTGKKEKQ